MLTADPAILERNLAALARTNRALTEQLRAAPPHPDAAFELTGDGLPTASLPGPSGKPRALDSRHHCAQEAARFAARCAIGDKGCFVIGGFGVGHHVAAVAQRLRRSGLIIVYEPDLPLLRSVLERLDHSEWITGTNLVIIADPRDDAGVAGALEGAEGLIGLGVSPLLDHPGSVERLRSGADTFTSTLARHIEAVRTTVVTSLVQVVQTVRNLTMNVDRYALGPGIADLKDAARGHAAVTVAAGPSLRRNLALLARPDIRSRVVIIAAQTVLKTMLRAGVKPHFVTALDHHEISRRFYEGLTAADVEGITLVVEPKANPAILDSFPGPIRCAADPFLDLLLGKPLAGEHGVVRPGATVAHLSYALARYLGCDPVILVGQDLGFTDGQYYAAGAAIHDVWSGELNAFNTLEMMEWQRIARMRPTLRRTSDTLGRPIYTDEQMHTYLVQFQKDFKTDADAGLTIIDATEGGVAKQYTQVAPLKDALAQALAHAPGSLHLPEAPPGSHQSCTPVLDRIAGVRADVASIGDCSRQALALLTEMLQPGTSAARINELITRTEPLTRKVTGLTPAFDLVQYLNQAGAFSRIRADRAISADTSADPLAVQKRQIERDVRNVTWLADVSDELGRMLDAALGTLQGAPRVVRDLPPPVTPESVESSPAADTAAQMLPALLFVDTRFAPFGHSRDLTAPLLDGRSPLQLTLDRLSLAQRCSGVIIATEDPAAARAALADHPFAQGIVPLTEGTLSARRRWIGATRAWAETCWRGGIGNLTVYDELTDLSTLARVLDVTGLDAALLVGADWCCVDPALCDAVIERHLERPASNRLVFTQAAPGLCGCVVSRSLAKELARGQAAGAGASATIGGVLGYHPAAPIMDPVASQMCVPVPPIVRDAHRRFIPDCAARRALIGATLNSLRSAWPAVDAETLCAAVAQCAMNTPHPEGPAHLTLELCTGRRTSGRRAHWERGSIGYVERTPMDAGAARRIIEQFAAARPDGCLTIAGAGDPLLHPHALELVRIAASATLAAVHIRTDGLGDPDLLAALADTGVSVISIDLMADSRETYRHVMGLDAFERAHANTSALVDRTLAARSGSEGTAGALPVGWRTPWIVPRLTRCDSTYADVEPFFDRWLWSAGWAVIDPLPVTVPGERIAPLPRPYALARREWSRRMTILSDGAVPLREGDIQGARSVGNALKQGVPECWRTLARLRRELWRHGGDEHPDLRVAS